MGAVAPTGLIEFVCTNIFQGKNADCLMYEIKASKKPDFCPKCGVVGPQTPHGYKTRYIRDLPNSGMQVILKLHASRYLCPSCGATYMQTYKTIEKQGHGYSFEVLRAMCLMSVNHIPSKVYIWKGATSEEDFIESWQF